MEKIYCRAGQATDENMAHAHCMLDALGYKHTIRIHNTYFFPTAIMDEPTSLKVTLHVPRLTCLSSARKILLHIEYVLWTYSKNKKAGA